MNIKNPEKFEIIENYLSSPSMVVYGKDDKNVYTIDYSNCKNENIKKKMIDAL